MNKKVFTLLLAMLSFFSMKSYATDVTVDVNGGEINIKGTIMNVPDFGKWVYFSFETGTVVGESEFELADIESNVGTEVPNADWAARTDWDITFHATDIRTNGAKALMYADGTTSDVYPLAHTYATLTEIPEGDYQADALVSGTFIKSMASMPPLRALQMEVCEAANGWATYGMNGTTVDPRIIVFELQNGKHVKVYLKEFLGEEDAAGYIQFSYEYFGGNNIDNPVASEMKVYAIGNELTIEMTVTQNNATATIYNVSGSLVKQNLVGNGQNTIFIGDLAAGVYIVNINGQAKKFIVK